MNKQSLAQHTPPPWHTGDETKVTGFGPLTAVYAGEVLIASTGGYSDNRADGGEQRARQEADARLIAAAPELLETVLPIAAALEDGYGMVFISKATADRIRASIALAHGDATHADDSAQDDYRAEGVEA